MKKYLKIIGVAILIGGALAFLFYRDINAQVKAATSKEGVLTLFQVGVFKTKENAQKFANTFSTSIIYEDEDYFRVIIGVTYSKEATSKMEAVYKGREIDYYLKEVRVSDGVFKKFKNYESVLLKSEKEDVIDNLMNSMLNILSSYL